MLVSLENYRVTTNIGRKSFSDIPKEVKLDKSMLATYSKINKNIVELLQYLENRVASYGSVVNISLDVDYEKLFYVDCVYLSYKEGFTNVIVKVDLKESLAYWNLMHLIRKNNVGVWDMVAYERYCTTALKGIFKSINPDILDFLV